MSCYDETALSQVNTITLSKALKDFCLGSPTYDAAPNLVVKFLNQRWWIPVTRRNSNMT